jgi:hypothetical protein
MHDFGLCTEAVLLKCGKKNQTNGINFKHQNKTVWSLGTQNNGRALA